MSEKRDIIDYLKMVFEMGGSDLHISVHAPPAARIDGELRPLEEFPLTSNQARELIMETMNDTQKSTIQAEWELDYALEVRDVGRFRGNVHYCRQEMEAVYRHIRGLVLVTGITGCGKTTTLAAMVKRIAEQRRGTIITLEDPIEFRFQHSSSLIKQREIGRDTKSYARALRQCMRQDPDVIVVGELRDRESMQIALTAAETGHLVLSTLHTLDAPKSVERILDVFPPDQHRQIASQLSGVLEAVICQRLLPRADGQGRVLATEVMRVTSGIEVCLRERKLEQLVGLMEIFNKQGNHTIDDCLQHLHESGAITAEEVMKHCRDDRRFSMA